MAYHCKACTEKHEAAPQQSVPMTTNLAQDLNAVKQSIATLDTKIPSFSNAIAQLGSINHVESNSGDHRPQPPSYASVVSVDMVKYAVSEVLREQHKVDTARLSVAVYGFPEEGKDVEQLFKMFDNLSCRCDVTRHSQIGHPSNRNSKSIRPIKVEFKSVSDTSSILSRANRLRHDDHYAGVYINKWLSNKDMKSMQQLRSQCERLNNDYPSSVNGRKQFVLISGKIKQHNASGQLHD